MTQRRTSILLAVTFLSACSGGSTVVPQSVAGQQTPQQTSTASAVRAPASVLARNGRTRADLGTSAYPISALAFPISALAFPISALAFAGAPPVSTVSCASQGGDSNSGDANTRNDSGPGYSYTTPVACKAQINTSQAYNPDPNAQPGAIPGVQPASLQYVYNLPNKGGSGQTVALVVAYDDPNAEADLAVYRNAFGLSPCTTANGCFTKVAGSGSTLPKPSAGWSVETSLDLDAVSAVCQSCKLLLVEAQSNLIPDLAAAVDVAVTQGATVVSNSYGVAEASDNAAYASHYNHPGVPMTAAAGDLAYGVQFPASVPSVTAVGGTSVQQIGNGAVQEVVWPLTGSGCSAFFPKPAYQHDTGCSGRSVADVSMVADAADGLSVYDSTLPNTPTGGWSAVAGTSLGAPLVAALYAMAASKGRMGSNAGIYAAAGNTGKSQSLINITSGTNGSCSAPYLCNGVVGYNGPTGNGVPWGIAAFAPTK